MDLLLSRGPSKRHELFYFGGPTLGALRIDDFKFQFYQQPYGWPGEKTTTDMPTVVNLRWDPFERTPSLRGESMNESAWGYGNTFFAREFWRFVPGAAGSNGVGADGGRVSANAGAGLVQPRSRQIQDSRGVTQPRGTIALTVASGAPLLAVPPAAEDR